MPQCIKCHYDLRASSAEGRCPECGYSVALSLRGIELHDQLHTIALIVSIPFAVVYTFYCFGTLLGAAAGEPFYRHLDWGHLLIYVIVPTAALVLWAGWALAVALLVWHRVLRWWWIVFIIVSMFPSFLLVSGMDGYVSDIIEMGSWESVPP